MVGVFIALIIALFQFIFITQVPEVIWLYSTYFLFGWYVVWSCILGALLFLFVFGLTSALTFGAGSTGHNLESKLLRGLGGLVGGGAISFLLCLLFFVSAALKIGGAYLLYSAVTLTEQGYVWNTMTLIFGTLALVIGLIMSKSSSSSSSSKT